jgi:hypothetical protein
MAVSEHKPSAEDISSDLQILSGLQARLEQHVSNTRGVWQELPQWADQLQPVWREQWEASQQFKELLKLLETRMEGERRERLEQLVQLGELRDLVQLVRAAVRLWESSEALELLRRLERIARRLRVKIPTAPGPAYETDFAAWAQHQALMVHLGQWENLDQEHLREELEALSRSEHSELESRLEVLITHLLKWQFDATSQNPRRLWRATIREQRHRLTRLLQRNPSLRPTLPDVLHQNYPHARLMALDETDLPDSILPPTCPWTLQQILDEHFLPEVTP